MKVQGYQRTEPTHEVRDADAVNLAMLGLLVFCIIGLCLLVCWIMLRYLNGGENTGEARHAKYAQDMARLPQPQLITKPGSERQRVWSEQEAKLESYGWVDRKAGVAHIPVDRAMELLVERGLPQVGAGQTRLQLLQSRPTSITQTRTPITSPTPEGSP
jgi:hypothetical protein